MRLIVIDDPLLFSNACFDVLLRGVDVLAELGGREVALLIVHIPFFELRR